VRQRLEVDPIACVGHGLCAELLPELIERDEWGYPILAEAEVPPHLLAHAKRAVTACPVLALKLRAASSPSSPAPSPQGIREDAGPGWPRLAGRAEPGRGSMRDLSNQPRMKRG
jgi:ferredoxin